MLLKLCWLELWHFPSAPEEPSMTRTGFFWGGGVLLQGEGDITPVGLTFE